MQPSSFQTRLAFLAALISGVILFGFGFAAWILIQEQFLRSVDARILGPAKGVSQRLFADNDWPRFEERWRRGWPSDEFDEEHFALVVTDPEGRNLFTRPGSEWTTDYDLTPWLPTDSDFLYPPPSKNDIDSFTVRPGSPFPDDRPQEERPPRRPVGDPRRGPGGPPDRSLIHN